MLLSIENLDVSYSLDDGSAKVAARDVSFTLDRGDVLGIVGESGSGKSSVALSVPRLLDERVVKYPKGRILLDGVDTLKMTEKELRAIRGSKIGVVFQDPIGSLSPLHHIGDQLIEMVLLHEKISHREAQALALEWLQKVGIHDAARRMKAYPYELSGGMQQRVMIAMAMMLAPSLVIADEPTTALDVTVQAQILKLMNSLKNANTGILLITHDLGVVSQMANRIVVMKEGRIVERSDDVREFFREPKHSYSRALVSEAEKMEVKL